MALEAFLVNPHRRKRGTSARKKRKGLPSALLKRMVRTYGPGGTAMRHAWAEYRRGITRNPWADDSAGHRRTAFKGWRGRRSSGIKRRRKRNPWESIHYRPRTTRLWRVGNTGRWGRKLGQKNPFGEEVMIVGNPGQRRRRVRRRRLFALNDPGRRRRRRRSLFGMNPTRRRRRSYRRRFYALNDPGRRRRRYRNRRYRRRFRRNPAAALPAISFRNPMSLLMPAAVGTGGFMAAEWLPTKIGMVSTWPRLGVKAGIAFGGTMVLGRFLGRSNGIYFAVGAGISLVSDILRTFIFKTTVAAAGVGAFPYQMGAYPSEFRGYEGFEAYPYEQSYPM